MISRLWLFLGDASPGQQAGSLSAQVYLSWTLRSSTACVIQVSESYNPMRLSLWHTCGGPGLWIWQVQGLVQTRWSVRKAEVKAALSSMGLGHLSPCMIPIPASSLRNAPFHRDAGSSGWCQRKLFSTGYISRQTSLTCASREIISCWYQLYILPFSLQHAKKLRARYGSHWSHCVSSICVWLRHSPAHLMGVQPHAGWGEQAAMIVGACSMWVVSEFSFWSNKFVWWL